MIRCTLESMGPRSRGVGSLCDDVPGDVLSAPPGAPRSGRSKPTPARAASGAERRLIYSKDTLEHTMENSPDDVLVWADGAWLFRSDLAAMEDINEVRWREPYTVLPVASDGWFALTGAEVFDPPQDPVRG